MNINFLKMDAIEKSKKSGLKIIMLFVAPLISLSIILFADLDPGNKNVTYTLAIAVLMALWWIFEPIPLAATSLLPVALFPLLGVVDEKVISAMYFNHLIFLFIGGFLMALAMERWNLHKRIALRILILFGISPGRILMGFMAATAFLSMWMSNTATAMMMFPIALSIIVKLEENLDKKALGNYPVGILLGVAYSASIGGIATLVGTPPNLSFARIFAIIFPNAPEVTFANWLFLAFPICALMFLAAWVLLYFMYRPKTSWENIGREEFRKEFRELGKPKMEEKIILTLFIILALLWVFRAGFDLGSLRIPGWAAIFRVPDYINDGTVAIFISLLLFMIPSKTEKGERLMNWKTANKIPWNIVLLFGGGFALAKGFVDSGLSLWFGNQMAGLSSLHPLLLILIVVTMISFLTELTSNTATAEMILPILAGLSVAIKINPLLLMIPSTIAASLAFMLPVATPPNAIAFGSGHLQIRMMVRTGFWLNMTAVVITTLMVYFLGSMIFDIDPRVFPDWAVTTKP